MDITNFGTREALNRDPYLNISVTVLEPIVAKLRHWDAHLGTLKGPTTSAQGRLACFLEVTFEYPRGHHAGGPPITQWFLMDRYVTRTFDIPFLTKFLMMGHAAATTTAERIQHHYTLLYCLPSISVVVMPVVVVLQVDNSETQARATLYQSTARHRNPRPEI
jgi:hypothetical protein